MKKKRLKVNAMNNASKLVIRDQTNKFRVNGSWQMFNKRFYRRFILYG